MMDLLPKRREQLNSLHTNNSAYRVYVWVWLSFHTTLNVATVCVFSEWLKYLRQFNSSESSVQSLVPSHLQAMFMHCPLVHWNSPLPQLPAENTRRGKKICHHLSFYECNVVLSCKGFCKRGNLHIKHRLTCSQLCCTFKCLISI